MSSGRSMNLRWIDRPFEQMPGGGGMFARLTGPGAPAGFPRFDPAAACPYADNGFVDRARLTAVLADYNRRMSNPLPQATLDAVGGDGLFVIAGQQPGLLTGPAYTLLKAIHAISLAKQLSASWRRPVLPAFWIATEDHDIAETSQTYMGGRRFVCRHAQGNESVARSPVGWISPQPWREQLIGFIRQTLPGAAHLEPAIERIEKADWSDYGSLFATLLKDLVGTGRIVLVDPFELRNLAGPMMAEAARQWPAVQDAVVHQGGAMLSTQGLGAALDSVNLFEFAGETRRRVDWSGGRFGFHDQRRTPDEAAKWIADQPQRVSPSAALRPVVQDAIMPVAATIAGPGELAYLWQLDPLYRLLGVNRSLLQPRLSVTLVDQSIAERAGRFGIAPANLLEAPGRYERFDPAELGVSDESLSGVERTRDQLLAELAALEAGPQASLRDKAQAAVDYHVNKLLDRLRLDRLARQGMGKELFKQVVDTIAPHGRAQERMVCGMEWVIRHGQTIIDELIDQAPTDGNAHQLVIVERQTES